MQQTIQSILAIVQSCDSAIMATIGADAFPDARHMVNTLNRDTRNLALHFFTDTNSQKQNQLARNPNCCLYYFNPETRHAVRLFGQIETVTDADTRAKMWRDDFKRFGYGGATDKNFALLRFIPDSYKFYIGNEMKTGKI